MNDIREQARERMRRFLEEEGINITSLANSTGIEAGVLERVLLKTDCFPDIEDIASCSEKIFAGMSQQTDAIEKFRSICSLIIQGTVAGTIVGARPQLVVLPEVPSIQVCEPVVFKPLKRGRPKKDGSGGPAAKSPVVKPALNKNASASEENRPTLPATIIEEEAPRAVPTRRPLMVGLRSSAAEEGNTIANYREELAALRKLPNGKTLSLDVIAEKASIDKWLLISLLHPLEGRKLPDLKYTEINMRSAIDVVSSALVRMLTEAGDTGAEQKAEEFKLKGNEFIDKIVAQRAVGATKSSSVVASRIS